MRTLFLFVVLLMHVDGIMGKTPAEQSLAQLAQESDGSSIAAKLRKKRSKHLLSLYFDNEDLIDVINILAAEKGVNIVLPVALMPLTPN